MMHFYRPPRPASPGTELGLGHSLIPQINEGKVGMCDTARPVADDWFPCRVGLSFLRIRYLRQQLNICFKVAKEHIKLLVWNNQVADSKYRLSLAS